MVLYGVVVWIPSRKIVEMYKPRAGLCNCVEPLHLVTMSLSESLGFIEKHRDRLCEAKIFKIEEDDYIYEHNLERFCYEIYYKHRICEGIERLV